MSDFKYDVDCSPEDECQVVTKKQAANHAISALGWLGFCVFSVIDTKGQNFAINVFIRPASCRNSITYFIVI
jgi:hypothetical protein